MPRLAALAIVGEAPPDPSHAPAASLDVVSPGYFSTMGIALQQGRSIAVTHDPRALKVAVVDELLARRFFGGRDPVGRQLVIAIPTVDTIQIVGVVRSVRQFGLVADEVPQIYVPLAQRLARRHAAWVALRTTGDQGPPIRALRQVVADLDPTVPVSDVKSMDERMVQTVGTTRFATLLASLFALVALGLGALGLYSVLAYIVSQRRRELAVRIALGASRSQVMAEVTRRAAALTGAAIALGMISAWILTRVLARVFVGVCPHDPDVFVGAALGFTIVALLSASVPAFRTTRVNPVTVLTSS